MLKIGELSQITNTSDKTIRYYEQIGLLPQPQRAENGYRLYTQADVDRLQFIRRARGLDFTLDDIGEILAFRERNEPPCGYVMNLMGHQIKAVEARIRDLVQMHDELTALYEEGQKLPQDVFMRECVCHLIQTGIKETSEHHDQTKD